MSDWLNTLFPTGLAAVALAAYKGVNEIRKGAHRKERGAIADLRKWREEQYDARQKAEGERDQEYAARREAERERDSWRFYAGKCEYELDQHELARPPRPKLIADEEAT